MRDRVCRFFVLRTATTNRVAPVNSLAVNIGTCGDFYLGHAANQLLQGVLSGGSSRRSLSEYVSNASTTMTMMLMTTTNEFDCCKLSGHHRRRKDSRQVLRSDKIENTMSSEETCMCGTSDGYVCKHRINTAKSFMGAEMHAGESPMVRFVLFDF
jgi:hypothetical protein